MFLSETATPSTPWKYVRWSTRTLVLTDVLFCMAVWLSFVQIRQACP